MLLFHHVKQHSALVDAIVLALLGADHLSQCVNLFLHILCAF